MLSERWRRIIVIQQILVLLVCCVNNVPFHRRYHYLVPLRRSQATILEISFDTIKVVSFVYDGGKFTTMPQKFCWPFFFLSIIKEKTWSLQVKGFIRCIISVRYLAHGVNQARHSINSIDGEHSLERAIGAQTALKTEKT